jgi:hypothetical protein
MQKANPELVESLHQFITIWRLIGKPFPQVDATDRPESAGNVMQVSSARGTRHRVASAARAASF